MKYFAFSILVIVGFLSCDPTKEKQPDESKVQLIEKVVDKYPDGAKKSVDEYQLVDGGEELYGFKEFHPSGDVKISGRFNSQKQREGLWKAFFENGNKWSVGFYENGVENGEKKVWYENGSLRYQGAMKDNKPQGNWVFWDESGNETTKFYP